MATTASSASSQGNDLRDARARLLEPAPRRGSAWAMLGAAGFAAGSGLALCVAVFIGASQLPTSRPPSTGAAALFVLPHG